MKIGNLQSVPWYLRLLMFVAVAAVVYGGFWHFVTKPIRAETKVFNAEIADLVQRNAQAQIASQRLNEFRAVYRARVEEYEELKALLPEQRELTMVLQSVQDRARTNGLVLRKFLPKDDVQQDNYSGKRIEVSVTSSFASLRNFFEQLAHYQRIVSITNFQLTQLEKQSSSKTVDATFDLTAYYVSAEKLQKPPAAGQPAGSGQVPPAALPPAAK
ncbi:MAG TPA: type 4a pilus biogenesis protein PilO [Pyrinomonadaceae bacterium]|jgi:Tfp pilus assembly protein PilO|nr:type 4a pilus biogenesis protein PilO [Pyrinomonadaceae bacterium]